MDPAALVDLAQRYGGPGLVIAGLAYAVVTRWKANQRLYSERVHDYREILTVAKDNASSNEHLAASLDNQSRVIDALQAIVSRRRLT